MAALLFLAVPAFAARPSVPASATSAAAAAPMRTPRFRRYGMREGLPSNEIYTTQQDRHGFIWIGTRNGLARFDGRHFKVFQHHPGKPTSLGANDTSEVFVDRQGRVWAGGEASGLNLYVPDQHGFRHWRHRKGDPHSLSANDVFAIAQTSDGAIWVGTFAGGLNRMQASGHGFTHVSVGPADPPGAAAHPLRHTVSALAAGPKDSLWIGTLLGLKLRDREGHLRRVHFPNAPHPGVFAITGPASHPYVMTNVGAFQVGGDFNAHPIMASPNVMVGSAVDPGGDVWMASRHGLFVRSPNGQVQHIAAHPHWRGRLPVPGINHVMFDRHGGLWVATRGGGLLYRAAQWGHLTYLPLTKADGHSTNEHVAAICADGHGHLLVSGPGFLERLDVQTGVLTDVSHTLWGMDRVYGFVQLSSARVLAWGLREVCVMGTDTCMRIPDSGKRKFGARDFVAGSSGHAYIGENSGVVYELSLNSGTARWRDLAAPASPLDHDQLTQLRFHDGRLWRAMHSGLTVLDDAGDAFHRVAGLPQAWVQAFGFSAGHLWLVTRHGLLEYRKDNGSWRRLRSIGPPHGDAMPDTQDLYIDHSGRLWLMTIAGLWRFDPATARWRDVARGAAESGLEFSGRHAVKMADGTVYMGTFHGVFGFRPDAMHAPPQPPQPIVDAVTVQRGGKKVALPTGRGSIRVRWDDRDLSIAISAPTFVDPGHTRYRFWMHGLEPGWVDTKDRNVREFPGLTAGNYTLDVEASGPYGAWGRLRAPLRIRVQAPPWATPWAWALYVLMAGALMWLAIRMWRSRLDQRHRMQLADEQRRLAEQASAAKTRFLANLSHEIRTPMTGVLGMAELLLAQALESPQRGYVEAIERSGTVLLKLVNDALDLARIETRGLELKVAAFSPHVLLQDVRQLESGLAARKGLTLDVRLDDDVPAFVRGDMVRVEQVLLNLVSNALKFTREGTVSVRISRCDEGLSLCVADTGPGIPEASRERLFQRFEQDDGPERGSGSGLGLAICRELVAAMGGRIELHSEPGEGSRFDVWLPLPASETGPEQAVQPQAGGEALSVLLVEDDPTVAEVIRGMLEQSGHTVAHHANGLNALAELESARVDVMLLDLNLPGVDGLQLMRMLRQRQAWARLPIVAITARSGGREQQDAEAAGADGFLRKPLSGRELQAELVRVVALRRDRATSAPTPGDVSIS